MSVIKAYTSAVTKAYVRAVIPGYGGGGYTPVNAELTTYITGLATPLSDAQLLKLDTFVSALKTGLSITTLSSAFDVMKIYAGETAESSVKNLVKDAHHSTLVNSPTWTQFEGIAGNGTTQHIEENWNGRTSGHAVAYTLNSASFGLYFRTFERGINKYNGVYSTTEDGGVDNALCIGSNATNAMAIGLNCPLRAFSDINTSGLYICSRTAEYDYKLYRNKSANNVTQVSTNIPNQSLVLLGRRAADTTVGLFNTSQIAFSFLGKGLSQTDVNVITDAFEAYMDANGKGVIA